jgi:pilus assembly protein Flp/PilA
MKAMIKKFWNDEAGLELVEYAVMGGLIVVALVVAISNLSTAVETKFEEIQGNLD